MESFWIPRAMWVALPPKEAAEMHLDASVQWEILVFVWLKFALWTMVRSKGSMSA